MDEGDRRLVLSELVVATLNAIKPGLTSAYWYRRATEPKRTRRDRIALMGDPAYYCELYPLDPIPLRSEGSRVFRWQDQVEITLWLQYVDNDAYALTSRKEFSDLLYSDPGGLLTVLFETKTYLGSAGTINIGKPENRKTRFVPLDMEAVEIAHELSLTVGIW